MQSSQNTDPNVSDPQMEEYDNHRGPPQEASYLSCISDAQDWVYVGGEHSCTRNMSPQMSGSEK